MKEHASYEQPADMHRGDDYRATAPLYDRFVGPLLGPVRRDIRTFVKYRGYRRVVDVCCGTGAQLRLLEGTGMELHGIDNSTAMLAEARRACSPDVSLHLLSAAEPQFTGTTFDCAILSFALHEKHPTIRPLIYENSRKLVRQGGTLIVADFSCEPRGVVGLIAARLLIPCVERLAGRAHYANYRTWCERGGLSGFLARRGETADIIAGPFGGAALCCAVAIRDLAEESIKRFGLLSRALDGAGGIRESRDDAD